MIRKDVDRGGRRPLLSTFVGNNRQMLNEIRDSLSHLRKNQLEGNGELNFPLKPELSQSTPNLLDKTTGGKMTRLDQHHQKTLAEIRDSLRPYQFTAPGGSGGGGGSENSSSASSTSSNNNSKNNDSNADVSKAMVEQLMEMGIDEDIAVRALKLSGNRSVDAAEELILHILESRNGISKLGYHVNRRPSLETRHGPSSPVTSDTNSGRSDSPSLNPANQRQIVVNGHQTPPPLPPRAPIGPSHPALPSRGQTPPPPLQSANPSAAVDMASASSGNASSVSHQVISGQMAQSTVIQQGHVQQMIKRISPTPQMLYHSHIVQQQQQQMGMVSCNGGVGHRSASPVTSLGGQPVMTSLASMQQFQEIMMAGSSPAPSSSCSPASSISGGPTHPRGAAAALNYHQIPPPPYNKAQAHIQARYNNQGVGIGTVAPSISNGSASAHTGGLHDISGQSGDLQLSAVPDIPVVPVTPESHVVNVQKKVVPTAPVSAARRPMNPNHMPVIMPLVRSKEVPKPMPQTATAPVVMSGPQAGLGMNSQGSAQNYISQVHTQINSPSLTPASAPVGTVTPIPSARSQPQWRGNMPIPITQQQPHHSIHHNLNLAHNIVSSGPAVEKLTATALPNQMPGRPTIQIHIQPGTGGRGRLPGGGAYPAGVAKKLQGGYYAPSDTTTSTPRSDSPESRLTNQSPLSVLSNVSSPSTNSDIPDKPPPPYPGKGVGVGMDMGHMSSSCNPPLPPRVPLHNGIPFQDLRQSKPPPPPPQSVPSLSAPSPAPAQGQMMHMKLPPSHLGDSFPQNPNSSSSSPSPSSPGMPISSPSPLPGQTARSGGAASSQNTIQPIGKPPPGQPIPSASSELGEETDTETISSDTSQGQSGCPVHAEKTRCMSPMPERKPEAWEKDRLRSETKVRNYSPQAFKFYMEQHVENVMKNHTQRLHRRAQLENEMAKVNLSDEASHQMRRMLNQKESNYIRLRRAKLDASMFDKIKTLGVGAFGEVTLVKKKDVGSYYAMKTLRKSNVIKRNQVAHVKAERDILAEADNEWVVKLYYSFQDEDSLYFVMDYVPGGDLMSLLIRLEIFKEPLAQFYIAELVLAIESVHRMGFIHRDIKPDNILIDKDGHIKLTDFGLCTGFRWTHNSKYYQKDGTHARQDSMEVKCQLDEQCQCEILKPLERRRQREKQRCLAHSLVGTPNYIAPEVLLRQGYTSVCDWWSVGVILYEMLLGHPPFYASTPAETQYKVIHWEEHLKLPNDDALSPAAAELIRGLCTGSDNRLGRNGAQEIKSHPFFQGINFEGLRKQLAPYKPTIRDMTDTSNFDPVDPDRLRDADDSKKVDSKLENGKHPEHGFFEFTFRRFFDDGGHPYNMHQDPESNSPVYV